MRTAQTAILAEALTIRLPAFTPHRLWPLRQPKDHPKQVTKIKNYLFNAIEKVLRWKLNPDERQAITLAERELHYANDEGSLSNVLKKLIAATQRFIA